MKIEVFSACLALGLAAAAGSAQATVVFGPTADVSASTLAHQGPHVAGSSIRNTNGVVSHDLVGPGGSTASTPLSPGATAVSAQAYIPGGAGSNVLTASSYGSANLATGALKASVVTTGPDNFGSPGGDVSSVIADTVHFNNITGGALMLDISYAFDGAVLSPSSGLSSSGSSFLQLEGCGSCGSFYFANDGASVGDLISAAFNDNGVYGFTTFAGAVPLGQSNHWFTSLDSTGYGATMSTRILVPTGLSSLGLKASLAVSCRSGDTCDYGNTGLVRFGALPTGLSYTSESGVFLSQVGASAVPEPAAWAMMIAGFGLVGGALRRVRGRALGAA